MIAERGKWVIEVRLVSGEPFRLLPHRTFESRKEAKQRMDQMRQRFPRYAYRLRPFANEGKTIGASIWPGRR